MRYLDYSEAGHDHINEDCVAVRRHPRDTERLICVLADGQGGQFGGGPAARAAVAKCLELASARPPAELLERETWRAIFVEVDAFVEEQSDAGFTTLIGLCVTPDGVCGASCGDSAALLVDENEVVELTVQQRKNPPLGSGAALALTFAPQMADGATLLLMSDGVWKFVGFERIMGETRVHAGVNLVLALRELQLGGNAGKLPDDFSVIAIWNANEKAK